MASAIIILAGIAVVLVSIPVISYLDGRDRKAGRFMQTGSKSKSKSKTSVVRWLLRV
jgi:hypothetical protein